MDWDLINRAGVSARPQRQYRQFPPIKFLGFPHGLNTSIPASQIGPTECSELVNFRVVKGGQVQTRNPISAHTSSSFTGTGAAKDGTYCPISGTMRELFVDSNDVLYYNNSGVPTSIGTLEGATFLLPYNGVCLLLDGSYVKYLDNLITIKIAYDNGEDGSSAYQYNNRYGSEDSVIALGNGTITLVAAKFSSQAWDAGYTIPPTTITVSLTRIGDGYTGTDDQNIVVNIRKQSDSSSIASKVLVQAPIATNLAAVVTEYEVTFSSSDITEEMGPSTDYYITVDYDNGDASHHVDVNCTDVASGGAASSFYSAAWHNDATKDPIMSLRPGRPPKAAFGAIHGQRPFVAGDPDNPGLCWFGNITFLDWSTSDGGGYVGSVDDNANNYPIGSIISFYNELYVFGKKDQPFICKLTGSSPSVYALPAVFQRSWATHKTLVATTNDMWFANSDVVANFVGVQEFGDMRTSPYADPISDRLDQYWDVNASALEYYPTTGQIWMTFPSYHRVLVCHTLIPSVLNRKLRFPWAEYEFTLQVLQSYLWITSSGGTNEYYLGNAGAEIMVDSLGETMYDSEGELMIALGSGDPIVSSKPDAVLIDGIPLTEGTVGALNDHEWGWGDNDGSGFSTLYVRDDSGSPYDSGVDIRTCIIPTMIKFINGNMLIGCSNGIVYKMDQTEYKDLTTNHMRFDLRTAYVRPHIDAIILDRFELDIGGKTGAQFSFSIYVNREFASPAISIDFSLPIDDRLTVSDLTMDADDAYFLIDPTLSLTDAWVQIECYDIQFRIHNVLLAGNRITFNSVEGHIRPLDM